MSPFIPTYMKRRIFDITPGFLEKAGIKGLLVDVDNTLTLHNSPDLSPEVSVWLEKMKSCGIKLIIISNNSWQRVQPFAAALGLDFLPDAKKPLKSGVEHCIKMIGLKKKEVALVGDQIFTDILAGNMGGIRTILLEPFNENEWWFIRFKRLLEKPFINIAKRKTIEDAD